MHNNGGSIKEVIMGVITFFLDEIALFFVLMI